MRIAFLALLLQAVSLQQQNFLPPPKDSQTFSPLRPTAPSATPIIPRSRQLTAPDLTPDTRFSHEQMEHELGGQSEAIGQLKSEVNSLQEKRERTDRPDIDDLKKSRDHYLWTWSILLAIITTSTAIIVFCVRKYGNVVWQDSVLPRIRKIILETPQSSRTESQAPPQSTS